MTRRELYNQVWTSVAPLYDHPEPVAIAERICAELYGFDRFGMTLMPSAEVEGFEIEPFERVLQRLSEGCPVQYVVGHTEFCDLRFVVREGVLVPRPETEELVRLIVSEWGAVGSKIATNDTPTARDENPTTHTDTKTAQTDNPTAQTDNSTAQTENPTARPLRLMDVGTGSGAIAVSLAKLIEGARVTAVDVSEDALAVASENAQANGANVEFVRADIFDFEPTAESLDVVVSNPPYIPLREREQMAVNVTSYEPSLALFVPDDSPIIFYERIADVALGALVAGGGLYFEVHEKYATEVAQSLVCRGFVEVKITNDIFSKPRIVSCRKPL